jgi:hypothetical protein
MLSFVLGVCERGSSLKTPTFGVFELAKGTEHGNTPTLVYFVFGKGAHEPKKQT